MEHDDETPFSLEEACKVLLRNAARPCTLRAEIRKGELEAENWGRGYRVTPRMIREWRERKRVPAKAVPTPKQPAGRTAHSHEERAKAARAHLEMILQRPRPPLPGFKPEASGPFIEGIERGRAAEAKRKAK